MKLGALFTPVTVIVKLSAGDVSTPPFAVPPLSWSASVIVAVPLVLAAGVYVSVPVGDTAGPALKSDGFVLPVMLNVRVCADSLAGPELMAIAQGVTVCGPAFSSTI